MMQGFLRPVGMMLLSGVFNLPIAGRIAYADEFKIHVNIYVGCG